MRNHLQLLNHIDLYNIYLFNLSDIFYKNKLRSRHLHNKLLLTIHDIVSCSKMEVKYTLPWGVITGRNILIIFIIIKTKTNTHFKIKK